MIASPILGASTERLLVQDMSERETSLSAPALS